MAFTLTTLGNCQLTDNSGGQIRAPLMALIMLAYLYETGQPIQRRDLAHLLWPGNRESAATNLRSTVRRLVQASAHSPHPLITTDGSTITVDRTALACDLDVEAVGTPVQQLEASCRAVVTQFLPSEGKSATPIDQWVRHVRARHVSLLRERFLAFAASPDAAGARAQVHRAAIVLLEWDPGDEEVRRHLSASPAETMPAASVPATAKQAIPLQPTSSIIVEQSELLGGSPPRVALLPPETLQGAQRAGSVANALIEDLTIDLCSSRAVSVVAPYTSERIRASKDKASLLERHRVIYALDTQRSGEWLFVQLIFMPTDEIVWAKRFQMDPRLIADQRAEIAGAIKTSLIDLMNSRAPFADQFHQAPEAYFAYLRGLQSLSDLTLPAVRKARRHFREALDHEQDFGMALVGISRTLSLEWILTARGDDELLLQAEKLANTAIERDGRLAGAYKELGVSQLYRGRIDDSLHALEQAETMSPHYADVLLSYSDSLVHAGKAAEGLNKVKAAIDLNPLSPDTYLWSAAGASFFLGAYSDSIEYISRMRDSRPADRLAAACWGMLGETSKARRCRQRVLKDNPGFDYERWLQVIPLKEDWQREIYREGLTKAGF
ncbi:hypothetical protein AAIH46_16025 [Rhizobium sp. 0TCS1.26]|uniref:hypothetical protein n=1 Tax=Rhizobium sp. 0TCS1.26 TaxID=3142623 RepID=UPI003D27D6EB